MENKIECIVSQIHLILFQNLNLLFFKLISYLSSTEL